MNKGIPLDVYLKMQQSAAALTDEDLDQQLYDSAAVRPKRAPGPSAPGQKDQRPEAAKSPAQAALENLQRAAERDEAIDTAVKAASHGVKVLAPLLTAVSRWVSPEDQREQFDQIMGTVLARVRDDAAIVLEAYGLRKGEAPPWLTAQVSGQIMEVLVMAIERNNGAMLDANDHRYLAPLINMAHETKGILEVQHQQAPMRMQLANALALATADVMTEYYSFSYFHADPEHISQVVSEVLTETVVEGTLEELTGRFSLTEDEVCYLGNSLLKQAGNLLSAAWSQGQEATEDIVRSMNRSTRERVMIEGYPLDAIIENFHATYQGVEVATVAALRTLVPHRENLTAEKSNGQRLG